MKTQNRSDFNTHEALHELKHYLPAQAPLKDFIHYNTLLAFQNLKFNTAIHHVSEIFGYKTFLSLQEYSACYHSGRISNAFLENIILQRKGAGQLKEGKENVLSKEYHKTILPGIGLLRANWKKQYRIDLDSMVHPALFRILCSYLDQGISIWNNPVTIYDTGIKRLLKGHTSQISLDY